MEILVEGRGRFEQQWFGRSRGYHGVIVPSPDDLSGQTVHVRITRGTEHTLFGERTHAASHRVSRPHRVGEISRCG